MIDFLAENARVIVWMCGGVVVAGYVWSYSRGAEKIPLHRQIYELLLVWLAGTSLPVSAFLVWMMFQPSLIPQMVGALQDFSMHIGVYGGVAFLVVFHSLKMRWPRGREDD